MGSVYVPDTPGVEGLRFYVQFANVDTTSVLLSNAVEFTVGYHPQYASRYVVGDAAATEGTVDRRWAPVVRFGGTFQ